MLCHPFHHVSALGLALVSAIVVFQPTEVRGTTSGGAAAPFSLRRWTTEDGLPKNTITSLLQTRDGYLWVGTRDGLARFDGMRFKVFTEELRMELHGQPAKDAWPPEFSCLDLTEDAAGRLWVRLPDGLVCCHAGRFEKFPTRFGPLLANIQTVIASRNGGLWIGTRDSGLKLFQDGAYRRDYIKKTGGLGDNFVGIMREDPGGRLWVGSKNTGSGMLRFWQRLDPQTGRFESLADVIGRVVSNVRQVCPDAAGKVWVATPEELLCWENGKLARFSSGGIWGNLGPGDMVVEPNGTLWCAPPFMSTLVRLQQGKFEQFGVDCGLADTDLRCLLPDREGSLWIGYGAGGLQRLRPGSLTPVLARKENGERRQIDSLAPGPGNAVWLGTWDGLLKWQDGSWRSWTNSILPPSHSERPGCNARPVLADASGRIWFGVEKRGLFTLLGDQIRRVEAADGGRSNWTVRVLHEDRSGRLWIGADDGVLEKRGDRFVRYTRQDGLLDEEILGIRDAADGTLWVGTRKGGIHRFQSGRFYAFTNAENLANTEARPLLAEDDGTIWVGTSQGLVRIRAQDVAIVTERQGLPAHTPFCLMDDGAGYYWANSVRGIFRLRKLDLQAVADGRQERLFLVSYGEADGAASAEGTGDYQPNACRTSDGRMWFSTTRGATVLDPAILMQRDVPPPVIIEEVLADDELIFSDGGPTVFGSRICGSGPTARLPAGRARVLEIHYTANSFVAPEKVRFRHRLSGADRQWREAGPRRAAFYTNLRPGAYRFSVEASTQEGTWSRQPGEFAFSIAPHLYERWQFYGLCAMTVGLAGFGLHHRRMGILRQIQRLEREQALQSERARIARDLHDDLGANLTGIALKADLAQRQLSGEPAAAAQLAEIATSTRSLVDDMRETVWALNPKNDTLEGLARFLAQQVEDFATNAGLRCRLELPNRFDSLTIPSPARYQIHMIVKEALHNAVKHAAAQELQFSLQLIAGELCVSIADDGQGFTPLPATLNAQMTPSGNGLANIFQRVQSLGGQWDLRTAAGQGTRTTVRIPLQAFREKAT